MPLLDRVHGFDSCDQDSSTPKALQSQHWLCHSFNRPVALLDEVVEVFFLAHQDVDAGIHLDVFNGRRIGAALVGVDLFSLPKVTVGKLALALG